MAGTVKERIRNWMRTRFPPEATYCRVYECADVCDLLAPDVPTMGLRNREGMVFTSRDLAAPAYRKELVILTSVLANYSAERIISVLEKEVAPSLTARPQHRLLVNDQLGIFKWGQSSVGGEVEGEPCDAPLRTNRSV